MEILKYSNKKYNQTLILITHDESIALQADRIIRIEDRKNSVRRKKYESIGGTKND